MSNDRKLSDIKVGGSDKPQRLPKPRIMGGNGGQDRLGVLPAPVGLLLGKSVINSIFENPRALWAANGSGPSEPRGNGTKEKDAGVGGSVDTDPDLDSGIDTDTEVDDWEPNSDVGIDGGLDVDTDSDTDTDTEDTPEDSGDAYNPKGIGISAIFEPRPQLSFTCGDVPLYFSTGRSNMAPLPFDLLFGMGGDTLNVPESDLVYVNNKDVDLEKLTVWEGTGRVLQTGFEVKANGWKISLADVSCETATFALKSPDGKVVPQCVLKGESFSIESGGKGYSVLVYDVSEGWQRAGLLITPKMPEREE